jgi:hypothetical protein
MAEKLNASILGHSRSAFSMSSATLTKRASYSL